MHRGQVGQPRPEPVSRTTPPVTTIAMLTTSEATASAVQAGGQPVGGPVDEVRTVTPT